MEALPKNVWKRLARIFPADREQSEHAAGLFREYESRGYLNMPTETLLCCPLEVAADFFRRMALMHSLESPVLRRRDTRWMSEFDYTLMNIRAAGTADYPGDFLRASLFLATLRTRGIILAPVTRGPSDDLTVLESHALIREELVNSRARDAGVNAGQQMAAFSEAAHLLGLVLGFDLDYRVDSLAAVVVNRPELFFWTKEGRAPRDEKGQDELRREVKNRIAAVRKTGVAPKRELFEAALDLTALAAYPSADGSGRTPLALRKAVPGGNLGVSEASGTSGVPGALGSPGPLGASAKPAGLETSGVSDASGSAGAPHSPEEFREEAVEYWGRVFDLWRDRYGFDFLLLRGTGGLSGGRAGALPGNWPGEEPGGQAGHRSSGRQGSPSETEPPGPGIFPEVPGLALVRRAADAARKAGVRRNVGVAAEGLPRDVEKFGVQGVDLVLGDNPAARADRDWFDAAFALDATLQRINTGRKLRFSVPLAVDPGSSERRSWRERALLKRFTARFLGVGPSRRPLLETMGALEGAWGYEPALKTPEGLGWCPDAGDARRGECLENIARRYESMRTGGEKIHVSVDSRLAWWVIRSRQKLLVPVVSVENPDLLPPEPFELDYAEYLQEPSGCSVLEFDFTEERGNLHLSVSTTIFVSGIPYRGFRLYVIS